MSAPLDEQFLSWLYSQVGSVKQRNRSRTHWSLARQLYMTEFIWFIPNDDNRLEDGRNLRYEFLDTQRIENPDPNWLGMDCSMLEMLIALARQLAFLADGATDVWFWHLIEQMDLEQYNDKNYDETAKRRINRACERIIWRTYSPSGRGGLFPLRRPQEDQREIELWYQLSAYLLELP